MPERNVIIVGAGIAGLSAALSLAEAGLEPLVLEADPTYAGGRVAGRDSVRFSHAGREWSFPGEHGVHGLWSQYRNLQALLRRMDVEPRLVEAGSQGWVYGARGRVRHAEIGQRLSSGPLPAPLHYFWLLADPRFLAMFTPMDLIQLPWVFLSMSTMLALDPMREGERMEGQTVGGLLTGWPPPFRAFAGALARSGLGTGSTEAPLAGFVALFHFYSMLRRDASLYHFLAADPETELIAPLVQALRKRGGEIRMGAPVTRFTPTGGMWTVSYERSDGETQREGGGQAPALREETARYVVLAADAPGTRALIDASDVDSAGLRWPEGQATATIRFWFQASPQRGGNAGMFGGDFTLDNYFWLHRIQGPFVEWHRETGGSAVEAHLYGPPALLQEGDATILSVAAYDVQRAFPELRGSLLHASLQRNPPVHTLFNVGMTQRHLGVETPWPGIFCCGDWVRNESPALFLERACATGLMAANRVRESFGLPGWDLEPYAAPEWPARFLQAAFRGAKRAAVRLSGR